MGYFPVRYDSRVVIYDRRGFIRLATGGVGLKSCDRKYDGEDFLEGVVKLKAMTYGKWIRTEDEIAHALYQSNFFRRICLRRFQLAPESGSFQSGDCQ